MAAALLGATSFTGCQTSAEKVESAKDDVENAKENLSQEQKDAQMEAKKKANEAEWKVYKLETEAKIDANDLRIKELRDNMKTSGKAIDKMYVSRIETLELKNNELRTRMDNYDKDQTNWESFKQELNYDLNQLGEGLKNLTVKNTK